MQNHGELKSIIEVGRCVLADWTDVFMLYLDVQVLEVAQEDPANPVEPLAVFKHNENGYNLALLAAYIVEEGFNLPGSAITLPADFHADIKWNAAEIEEIETGNTGTRSDNIEVKLVDAHGREMP